MTIFFKHSCVILAQSNVSSGTWYSGSSGRGRTRTPVLCIQRSAVQTPPLDWRLQEDCVICWLVPQLRFCGVFYFWSAQNFSTTKLGGWMWTYKCLSICYKWNARQIALGSVLSSQKWKPKEYKDTGISCMQVGQKFGIFFVFLISNYLKKETKTNIIYYYSFFKSKVNK